MNRQEIVNLVISEMARDCKFDLSNIFNDLSRGEVGVLCYLTTIEKDVSAGMLSEHFSVTSARIANVLNALEKKNYILRQKSETDKRKIIVSITDEGRLVVRQAKQNVEQILGYIVDEIGIEDAIIYIEITKRIKDALQRLERSTVC